MSARRRLLFAPLLLCASWPGVRAVAQSTSTPPAPAPKPPEVQLPQAPPDQQGPQPPPAQTRDEESRWRFTVAPYVWIPQVHGDLGDGGESSGISLGFGDSFAFAYAVPAHLEISHDDFTLLSDVLYLKIKSDSNSGSPSSEADAYIAEIAGAWKVYDSAPSRRDPSETRWTIEPLFGFRYYGASVGVDIPSIGFDATASKNWLDGMAGVRAGFSPSDSWRFAVRGDIAAGSSFTWNVLGSVEWSIADWFALDAGYRVLDIDYRSGGAADRFEFNVQLRGPFLAAVFRF